MCCVCPIDPPVVVGLELIFERNGSLIKIPISERINCGNWVEPQELFTPDARPRAVNRT